MQRNSLTFSGTSGFFYKPKLWWFYLLAYLKRHRKLSISSVVLIFVFFLGIWIFSSYFYKASLVEGIVGTYTQRDIPEVVTKLLSQSLVSLDSSGKPVPNLVENWQVNNDSKIYIFRLKKNLTWIDGSPIKASDINFTLSDVDVSVLDDRTIQFKISDSFSPFPTLLTKPIFKKDSLKGTGPYKIKAIRKDQIFVKKMTLTSKDKDLPNLTIKFYPNERIARNALKLGEIQTLLGITEISDLSSYKNLSVFRKTNYQQIVTIFYNTKDPILADENLRLALSFQAPSNTGEEEAKTSIPPNSWAYNPEVKDYLGNSEQSRIYLSKVQNLENLKSNQKNVITLTAVSSLKNVGEKIVQEWNKLGIKAVLRVESGIPQNFQALLITQNIPIDPDQYSLWHSTQNTNLTKFSNPRIDKNLEDGRKTSNSELRKQKYKDFQKVLLDHAPATFLYFPKYNVIFMKKAEKNLFKVINLQI